MSLVVSWNAEGFGTTPAPKRGQYHEHLGWLKQHPNTAFDTRSHQAGGAAVPLTSDVPAMKHPPNTGTGSTSRVCVASTRAGKGELGNQPLVSIPCSRATLGAHQSLPLLLHMTVLHPRDGRHCPGDTRSSIASPKQPRQQEQLQDTQHRCGPCPYAQVYAGGKGVDFNSSAGNLLPTLMEI